MPDYKLKELLENEAELLSISKFTLEFVNESFDLEAECKQVSVLKNVGDLIDEMEIGTSKIDGFETRAISAKKLIALVEELGDVYFTVDWSYSSTDINIKSIETRLESTFECRARIQRELRAAQKAFRVASNEYKKYLDLKAKYE